MKLFAPTQKEQLSESGLFDDFDQEDVFWGKYNFGNKTSIVLFFEGVAVPVIGRAGEIKVSHKRNMCEYWCA
jgi:hypothetical protein